MYYKHHEFNIINHSVVLDVPDRDCCNGETKTAVDFHWTPAGIGYIITTVCNS